MIFGPAMLAGPAILISLLGVDVASMLANAGGSCSRGCTTSDKLHWWGRRIGDAGCATLATLLNTTSDRKTPLQNLLLGGNDVGDACMASLAELAASGKLRSLRSLGLSNNKISDNGCERIAAAMERGQLPFLSDLYMSRNAALGDRCAAALGTAIAARMGACGSADTTCGSPRMERLSLNENHITDVGFTRLLHALAQGGARVRIRELSFNNNSLCRGDASVLRAALEALAGSRSERNSQRPIKLFLHSARCRAQKELLWNLTDDAMKAALKVSM